MGYFLLYLYQQVGFRYLKKPTFTQYIGFIMKKNVQGIDLISFSNLSLKLTGRKDIIRKDRISAKYKDQVKELENLINYWLSKHKK